MIQWLLEDDNPAVKYRTQTEIPDFPKDISEAKQAYNGKYILDGSLTKPYIKTEKVGRANKWVTFYALLAEKYCNS